MHCLVLAMVGLKLGAVIVIKNLVGSTLPSSIEWHNSPPDPCIPQTAHKRDKSFSDGLPLCYPQ